MLVANKVVIISGIGPGLGVKLALLAAQEGAAGIVVSGRSPQKLDDAEQVIRAAGLDTAILKVATDISNRAECERLAEQAMERFGRIDGLINNAYFHGEMTTAEHAQLEDWRKSMEVNLFGTMNMTLAVIPHMKKTGSGSIVMINTMAIRKPFPPEAGYSASKAALSTTAAYLAEDLGKYGIRVNSAYMGWMGGASLDAYFAEQAREQQVPVDVLQAELTKHIPLRRIVQDSECAKAALFLVSDYSSGMTGAQLDVNGGHYLPR